MINLDKLNEDMIKNNKYKERDLRLMQKVSMLKEKNDYDNYLIICTLCNYDIPDKKDMLKLRMEYFQKVNNSGIDYSHTDEDYEIKQDELHIQCKNTGNVNKYGLYEYEINSTNNGLVSDLWSFKDKDCLKYVDNKTFPDKIIVSIRREQLDNFTRMLDKLVIGYDIDDLREGLFYTNSSGNSLIDISKFNLPFTPYDFQLEDAKKLVSMKRALIGHEMGCGKTFISILIGESIDIPKLVICPESLRLN